MDDYLIDKGDVFNETDSDTDRRVIDIRPQKDPPTVLCRAMKRESDSDENTESEYCLDYVTKCVKARKDWRRKGYYDYDVRDIYQVPTSELISALKLTRQSTEGTKQELRYRMMSVNNIVEVPSDIEDPPSDENAEDGEEEELPPLEEVESSDDGTSDGDESDDAEEATIAETIAIVRRKRKSTRIQKSKKKKEVSVSTASSTMCNSGDDSESEYQPKPRKK